MAKRKLGVKSNHRRAMLRGMTTFLLEKGQIETTVTRAKEVRATTEKMITLAKTSSLHNKKQALAYITKEDVVKKLFDEIAPLNEKRNGGYTRIIKKGPRRGDAAEMAIIQIIDFPKPKADKKLDKKAAKQAEKEAKKAEKEAPVEEVKTAEKKPAAKKTTAKTKKTDEKSETKPENKTQKKTEKVKEPSVEAFAEKTEEQSSVEEKSE